ncbi:predicted protein [Lichtheimia corymbifera JMRC:FSU:9682]|uniref:Matrin-type domain-containing protein n=1 Tax=Lichtheimia corymbifera JMRC:FSU:9682 TaxID=1263082 RepID=A0A068RMW7_9FUNG|nr:predicted protein [Lichtheimia corymbifera JMRC:FSU:9682]
MIRARSRVLESRHFDSHLIDMADFWVSAQKHWCKYCKKFIANNKPSLEIHNNGRAHKEAVERFLRGVYKDGQLKKEEEEEKMRELQRIEKAAVQSFIHKGDRGSLSSTSSVSDYSRRSRQYPVATSSATPTPPPPTLEELQGKAPTIPQNLQGRDEWAIPAAIAEPGQWQTMLPAEKKSDNKPEKKDTTAATSRDVPPEFQDDEQEDEEDLRNFKIREKEYPADALVDDGDDDKKKDTGGAMFKKRKLGKEGSKRKIRRKTEDND